MLNGNEHMTYISPVQGLSALCENLPPLRPTCTFIRAPSLSWLPDIQLLLDLLKIYTFFFHYCQFVWLSNANSPEAHNVLILISWPDIFVLVCCIKFNNMGTNINLLPLKQLSSIKSCNFLHFILIYMWCDAALWSSWDIPTISGAGSQIKSCIPKHSRD